MSDDGGQFGWRVGFIGYNSESGPPKEHSTEVWSQLAKQFQRRFKKKVFQ